MKEAGIELPLGQYKPPKKGTVNDKKIEVNLMRTRRTVRELAYCNEWDYFITVTVNPKKYNREDLSSYHSRLSHWIRNQNNKYGCKIQYMMIPETHKKGGWHEHGFIRGIPHQLLREFTLTEQLPYSIRNRLKQSIKQYEWIGYRDKFGYCNLEPIISRQGAAKYITKYISKNIANTVQRVNAKMYYCSQGLTRAKVIKAGTLIETREPDYTNEYIEVWNYPQGTNVEQLKNMITERKNYREWQERKQGTDEGRVTEQEQGTEDNRGRTRSGRRSALDRQAEEKRVYQVDYLTG